MSQRDGLDELLAKESPEMVERINQKADEIIAGIRLAEIRQWLEKPRAIWPRQWESRSRQSPKWKRPVTICG